MVRNKKRFFSSDWLSIAPGWKLSGSHVCYLYNALSHLVCVVFQESEEIYWMRTASSMATPGYQVR